MMMVVQSSHNKANKVLVGDPCPCCHEGILPLELVELNTSPRDGNELLKLQVHPFADLLFDVLIPYGPVYDRCQACQEECPEAPEAAEA